MATPTRVGIFRAMIMRKRAKPGGRSARRPESGARTGLESLKRVRPRSRIPTSPVDGLRLSGVSMHDTAADIHREIVRPSESAGEGWTPPLNGVPSLRRNVAWAAIGNAGYAACQWGVLIVLTKLTTAADVGRFALGLAVTAPVMIAAGLQLRMVQATDARGEYPFGVYLGLRLVTTALAFATIGIIAISAGYRGDTLLVITFVALAKAFEAVSDIIFGLF